MTLRRVVRMTGREVIEAFVTFLATHRHPGLFVEDWPEDHKDGEIDAVAADLAIEHEHRHAATPAQRLGLVFATDRNLEQEVPRLRKLAPWRALGRRTVLLLETCS